jgi:hypothetical protein
MTKQETHKKSLEAAERYLAQATDEELKNLRTPDPKYNEGVTYTEYSNLVELSKKQTQIELKLTEAVYKKLIK